MRPLPLALLLVAALGSQVGANTVGVVVIGEASYRDKLEQSIGDWLRTNHQQVADVAIQPRDLTLLTDCLAIDDHACARKIVERRDALDAIVYAQVDVVGTTEVTIKAYWIAKQRQVAATVRACENCTDEALRTTTAPMMTLLAASAGAIVIDGRRPSRVLPVSLVIGGACALAAGGVELYLGTKGGPDDKRVYPNATAIGAALTGVGVVAIAVGVLVWPRGRSAPVAAITSDHAMIGWTGQF